MSGEEEMRSECTALIKLETKSVGEMSGEEEMASECTALITLETRSEGEMSGEEEMGECTALITLETKSEGEMSGEEDMVSECTALITLETKSEGEEDTTVREYPALIKLETKSEGEGKREEEMVKLKTFVHEHPLTPLDGITNGKNCNECGLYITGPALICNTCDFSIHKSCVELPSQIHHPLHPNHPLTLSNSPSPPTFNGIFFCELCRNIRDCYSYSCTECHFALDSHCALCIPTSIQHLIHHHPLDLVINEHINYPYGNRKTLTKSKAYYECNVPDCKQILGFNLAFLPPTGKHKVHRHQLKLTFLPLTEIRPEEPFDDPHGEFRPKTVEEYYCDAPEEPTLATLVNLEDEYYCGACEELRWGDGLLYCCEECDFTCHTTCIAPLQFQIFIPNKPSLASFKDQSHNHVLTLFPPSSNLCAICTIWHSGYPFYGCDKCRYLVGVICATKLPSARKIKGGKFFKRREMKKGVMMDIKQRHQHPLVFSDVNCESERCYVCRLPISGANYRCDDCKFFLHNLCTQLPVELVDYFINGYHTLALAEPPSPLYLNNMFKCAICNTPGDGFSYHCDSWCAFPSVFVCHVDCALNKPHNVTHKCHKHPLTLRSNSGIGDHPLCCACGTEVNYMFYSCPYISCEIRVHVECMHLPVTVSHESHIHTLFLNTYILEPFYCGICGAKCEWKGWAYSCGDCEFVAHIYCICHPSPYIDLGSTLEHENHEHPLTLALKSGGTSQYCSHCDEPFKRNLVYQCLKCNYNIDLDCASRVIYAKPLELIQEDQKHGKGLARTWENTERSEMALEREHFSHLHPLVLLDEQSLGERCNGCRLVISGGPSYGCIDCKVFLHQSCLELPHKIMLPFHREHPLTLSKDPPPPFNDGIFYCCLCMTPGDGFSYSCAECDKFVLHVHCALRTPMEIRDAGHEHLLALESRAYGAYTGVVECYACRRRSEDVAFLCRNRKCRCRSGFALHVNCVSLSPQKKCRSHRHTLTLVYDNFEKESYVYYCNACEEERDPTAWVYRCEHENCDFFAHTSCDPFLFLKLGGSRKIESHDHPVTLTARIGDINQDQDHGVLSGLRYECTECTYELDFLVEKFNYSALE